MTKILAALGVGAALMLTPVLAYADDAAAPKADAAPAAKPMKHHKHHAAKPAKHHHMAKAPKKSDDKKMDKSADAPKT